MKNRTWFRLYAVLAVLLVALVIVPLVSAKGLFQDDIPNADVIRVMDMAFLLPLVAFIKARSKGKLKDWGVIGVAFVVWCLLWFTPEITGLWQPYELIISCLKQFFGAMGSFDLTMDVKEKFAKIDANA